MALTTRKEEFVTDLCSIIPFFCKNLDIEIPTKILNMHDKNLFLVILIITLPVTLGI